MIVDPTGCARKIVELHGATGELWLERLPTTMADCARRWSLTIMPPFEDLSYNYVAPAIRQDGTHVVVKAGVPHPELTGEIKALQFFDGSAVVRLLDADIDQGVLLLERLRPGTPLTKLDDEQATQIAARVMRELWKPAPLEHSFRTIAQWATGLERLRMHFDGGYGPFPSNLVDTAVGLFAELVDQSPEPVLLHGDFHHQNILASERAPWLAIDPKGVVGDRTYDVATFASSFPGALQASRVRTILARRIDQLSAELGFDRKTIISWGLAHTVLSGWWNYEDHGHGWEWSFALAELYASLG